MNPETFTLGHARNHLIIFPHHLSKTRIILGSLLTWILFSAADLLM